MGNLTVPGDGQRDDTRIKIFPKNMAIVQGPNVTVTFQCQVDQEDLHMEWRTLAMNGQNRFLPITSRGELRRDKLEIGYMLNLSNNEFSITVPVYDDTQAGDFRFEITEPPPFTLLFAQLTVLSKLKINKQINLLLCPSFTYFLVRALALGGLRLNINFDRTFDRIG